MTLKVVEYLRKNGLVKLAEEFAIKAKRHNEYPNLVLLKYSQIDSPKSHPIVIECRGVILDEADDWKVVCRSFDRFFNYEESCSYNIDFLTARAYEKLDGSLLQLFYYDDKWHCSTSGSADANGNVGDFGFTFKELFWKTWDDLGYQLPTETNKCYSFELTTLYNTIVVQHQKSKITLLGCRDLVTQKELNPVVEAHHNMWPCVKLVGIKGKAQLEESLVNMDGSKNEGYVLCDENYNRIKMKCSDYVARHRLVSNMSSVKNIIGVIITGEGDEVVPKLPPELTKKYWQIKCKYEYIVGEITGFYDAIKHMDDRKLYATFANKKWFSGALFGMRFNGTSAREFLRDLNIKWLKVYLGVKEDGDEE